jgi:hypothetical protein
MFYIVFQNLYNAYLLARHNANDSEYAAGTEYAS